MQPTRLMDSRSGLGVPKAKIGPAGTVALQVAGKGGVPATGVTAVVLNVTATNPTAATFVSVYPDGTTRTSASNLNIAAGQTRPNLVVVPVVNGKVSFYNHAGAHVILVLIRPSSACSLSSAVCRWVGRAHEGVELFDDLAELAGSTRRHCSDHAVK
ncbi:hypothetical protein ACFV3S_00140 [Streptomyces sp. NPDC059749]|uniref:hypothetical protein n=1 Tax=Streptomyces sp. NPDC059749 TaxID=3346931 RepID=UPI003657FD41